MLEGGGGYEAATGKAIKWIAKVQKQTHFVVGRARSR
jgi:hypothetical protein